MKKPILSGLVHALGVAAYCGLVAGFFQLGERAFGDYQGSLLIVLMLVLLVLSAAITGSLVFGYPVYLVYKGKTKLGLEILISTLVWLLVIVGVVLGIIALFF